MRANKTQKLAFLGLFAALAILMAYIEAILPIQLGIPGVKLGIPNIVIIFVLYVWNAKNAFAISLVRILVIGLLFGNLYSILFSLAGALVSFFLMLLLKKCKFSRLTVSIVGGVSHNVAQLFVASMVVKVYSVLYFLPIMIGAGILAGTAIGILSSLMVKKLQASLKCL